MRLTSRPWVPALLAAVALLAACAPADEGTDAQSTPSAPIPSASGPTSTPADECLPGSLDTIKSGTLTIATDDPVYEPWFVDNLPSNGKGFEGAVAKAVADQLGYPATKVAWVRVPFNAAIQPGPKKFDFDINEFSITEKRRQAADFSSPYYDVTQAVITTAGSKAAHASSLANLRGLRLGAQVGTTSYSSITDVVKPTTQPRVYNNNDDAKAALQNGQIDALVVDLPTAFYITSAQLDNGKIVGQLPDTSGKPEQFGLVLDKGSPITACVSKAVDALRDDGTLDDLEKRWLNQSGGAPILK